MNKYIFRRWFEKGDDQDFEIVRVDAPNIREADRILREQTRRNKNSIPCLNYQFIAVRKGKIICNSNSYNEYMNFIEGVVLDGEYEVEVASQTNRYENKKLIDTHLKETTNEQK